MQEIFVTCLLPLPRVVRHLVPAHALRPKRRRRYVASTDRNQDPVEPGVVSALMWAHLFDACLMALFCGMAGIGACDRGIAGWGLGIHVHKF